MQPSEVIWMNGEFVRLGRRQGARPHARPALRDRRLRGRPLLRHRESARRSSATRITSTGSAESAELYYMDDARTRARGDPPGDARADRAATGCAPATSARSSSAATARWASSRSTRRSTWSIAVWQWGAYLGEEGKQQRHPREGLARWRRISPDALIPHAKAVGPVPQLDPRQDRVAQGRLRRGDPARRARLRLRGLGREHLRRPRRRDRHAAADRVDPRRDQPQVGDPDRPRPRLRGGRARHRPRRALPGRRDLPDAAPPPSWSRCARSTTTRSATAARARSPARVPARRSTTPSHGRDGALPRVARPGRRSARSRRRREPRHVELYDTTLRDGMQGEGMSLTAEEKVRVVRTRSTSSAST